MVQFPPVREKSLDFPHFPTKQQCLIYRLWDVISPARMAEVLETDEATVLGAANDMGLTPTVPPAQYQAWLDKGYITIIRAVWHLLPYDQITRLLGWTEEKLAFILHEDDFLDVKLGFFKPECEKLTWRELTEQEKARTAELRRVTETALSKLPPVTKQPFAFGEMFRAAARNRAVPPAENRFENRIIYSYCALYGDTFLDRTLIDESFPDALMAAYQAQGINAVWTQAVLYKLSPFPFEPELNEGYEQRLEGLNYLIAKLKKYGIKLFLYLNEPRPMPAAFFEKYPDIRGVEENGFYALCVSQPVVQEYLRYASEFLASHAKDLGGYFTITASENLTNCYAHYDGKGCRCARCAEMTAPDMYALVNRLLYEGAKKADPDFQMVAWTWGWYLDGMVPETIDRLPEGIGVMGVSEQQVEKNIGGTVTHVVDYSISVEGPGTYALDTWKRARARGHKTLAKIQANNSWELAAVPCIPVFEKVYRHLTGLCENDCVDSLMLSWTLGGYPSPTLSMLCGFYDKNAPLPTLDALYESAFGAENAKKCKDAFHLLSEAFDAFPFDISVAYFAPQHYAPADILYRKPTGYEAAMVGFPYDDLEKWRSIYPEETFVAQLEKLSDGWRAGLCALEKALDGSRDAMMTEILDCARVCDNHFRSMLLQCRFVQRRSADACLEILNEESDIALSEAAIMAHNPTIGYESSNHYFYTRAALLEKVLNCEYLAQESKL